MNRFLLDTHALIWFVEGDSMLSQKARGIITDVSNEILVSLVSLWEIAIKISIGKLKLSMPLKDYFQEINKKGFTFLNTQPAHILLIETLPWYHKDPFDRMLIAQGLTENIPLVSKESVFDEYKVKRVW